MSSVVVAGLGSEERADDGVGPLVAVRASAEAGARLGVAVVADPLDLLGRWDGVALAVVVDAVRSGAPPGAIHVIELPASRGAASPPVAVSTHGIDLAGVLRLARAVGSAPDRVVVIGVEGSDFGRGHRLSPAVAAAVPAAVQLVLKLIREEQTCV